MTVAERRHREAQLANYDVQRGLTATPAGCLAALYGVDCMSVRAANAVSLSRARHLSACLFHVLASGAIIAAAEFRSIF